MELVTNIVNVKTAAPVSTASKLGAAKMVRDNANLRQQLLKMTALKNSVLSEKSTVEAALAETTESLNAAHKVIAELRLKVVSLTSALNAAAAAAPKSKGKYNKKTESPVASGDSPVAD